MRGSSRNARIVTEGSTRPRASHFDEPCWSFLSLPFDGVAPPRPSFALIASRGPADLLHAGRRASLDRGDFAIVDLSLPLSIGPDADIAYILDFGDRALDRRLGDIRAVLARRLPGTDAVGAVAQALLGQLASLRAIGHGHLGDGVVATIVALVAILVSRTGAPGRTRHAAAMLQRAQGVIAVRLDDPGLRVTGIADQLGISTRHLSSLFEPVGQSPTQYILASRLKRAHGLLTDPAQSQRQIADIAMACGFDDQSYFARCFKARFGMTPRQYRDADRAPSSRTSLLDVMI